LICDTSASFSSCHWFAGDLALIENDLVLRQGNFLRNFVRVALGNSRAVIARQRRENSFGLGEGFFRAS